MPTYKNPDPDLLLALLTLFGRQPTKAELYLITELKNADMQKGQ